jgi:hypothetical protein
MTFQQIVGCFAVCVWAASREQFSGGLAPQAQLELRIWYKISLED